MDDSTRPLREPAVTSIERAAAGTVVRLAGELDLHSTPELRDALAGLEEGAVVLDLARVEFVDSTVLGVLVELHARLGGGLRLAAPTAAVRRALEVSGLDRRLRIFDAVEPALAA